MKNKLRRDIFVIIFLLLVACIALAVPLAFSNPRWLLAPALLVVFALVGGGAWASAGCGALWPIC